MSDRKFRMTVYDAKGINLKFDVFFIKQALW